MYEYMYMKRFLFIIVYVYIGTDIGISEQGFYFENDTPRTKNDRYDFI